MRIAAIYIENHEYLFDNPQTINFGGEYIYNFTKENDSIIISRTVNENFIDGFFDLTHLNSSITNINAIVGQNGAGKSTLLDIIRSNFIENDFALPQSKSLFLVETKIMPRPYILRSNFKKVYLTHINSNERLELSHVPPNSCQTIFYSPHYDYSYNPNFDDVDNHDISFYKIIDKDLKNLKQKDTNENGITYTHSQELLFKNSLRQIEFLSSELVSKQKIFKDIFDLPTHYEPILYFRGYKKQAREFNTPYGLRNIINIITSKLDVELNNWGRIKKISNNSIENQIEINQYILKRNIITCLISLLKEQMEDKNFYLFEGDFPYEKFKKELEEFDAYNTFILFIENSSLKTDNNIVENIFGKSIINLLTTLYEVIDKTENEISVSNNSLRTSSEDAIKILHLQRQFLIELNYYYYKFYEENKDIIMSDIEKIEEFINYMPFSRRLSSGENALLNFFSRIYDFLNSNLKENKFRILKNHYILLLDEADLAFHPTWKKRYVKALIKTLPYFFNELENTPSLQIIFTTHDPLTLSDLPNPNVIYIERKDYESKSKVLDYSDQNRPLKTFGANVSDLIADSFFIENSLIGDFVFDKIRNLIIWLNEKDNIEDADYYRKLVKLIDEPIVQRKLSEMYDDKMQSNFQIAVINEQIKKLEELKKRLEN